MCVDGAFLLTRNLLVSRQPMTSSYLVSTVGGIAPGSLPFIFNDSSEVAGVSITVTSGSVSTGNLATSLYADFSTQQTNYIQGKA